MKPLYHYWACGTVVARLLCTVVNCMRSRVRTPTRPHFVSLRVGAFSDRLYYFVFIGLVDTFDVVLVL